MLFAIPIAITCGDFREFSPKLWSKSGKTSEVRHDAAYVELPGGKKLIIVILTQAGDEKPVVPAIARHLLAILNR